MDLPGGRCGCVTDTRMPTHPPPWEAGSGGFLRKKTSQIRACGQKFFWPEGVRTADFLQRHTWSYGVARHESRARALNSRAKGLSARRRARHSQFGLATHEASIDGAHRHTSSFGRRCAGVARQRNLTSVTDVTPSYLGSPTHPPTPLWPTPRFPAYVEAARSAAPPTHDCGETGHGWRLVRAAPCSRSAVACSSGM